MASKFERLDVSEGWQKRQFRDMKRKATEQRAAKRLPASDLSGLPGSSIPTDKLASPVAPGFLNIRTGGYSVTVAGSNVIDVTVLVPSGFTACVVTLTGRVFAYNTTSTPDFLYAQTVVAGATSNAFPAPAQPAGSPGEAALNVAPSSTVLTSLSDRFTVQLLVSSVVSDWSGDPDNLADLTGSLLWFA